VQVVTGMSSRVERRNRLAQLRKISVNRLVDELATVALANHDEAWNVSPDFIRDLFRDERDIVRWVRSRPGKRRYIVIRIPASATARVYRRAQQRA
jgi:hypothetical protein